MVKKLFKHEFLAWSRIVPLFFLIAPVAALMFRLLELLETDFIIFDLIRGMTLLSSVVGVIVCIGAPVVFGITRFYKNLFTGEGYLTFTLPVKTSDQLLVKIVTAGTFSVCAVIVALFTLLIFLAGEPLEEIVFGIRSFLSLAPQELEMHLGLYILEILLILIVGLFTSHLQYYSCICLGQLSRKNRILSAVAAYFLYYVIAQVLSSLFSLAMLLLANTSVSYAVFEFMDAHPFATIHLSMLFSLLICIVFSGVFYLICHHVIHKKLNLE